MEERVTEFNKQSQTQSKEILSLRDTVDKQQRQVLQSNVTLGDQINNLLVDNTKLNDNILKAREETEKQILKFENEKQQTENLRLSITKLEQDATTNLKTIESIQTIVGSLKERLNKKEDDIKQLHYELEDKCIELNDKQEQISKLQYLQERYEQLLIEKDELRNSFENQLNDVMKELKIKHEEARSLQTQIQEKDIQFQNIDTKCEMPSSVGTCLQTTTTATSLSTSCV